MSPRIDDVMVLLVLTDLLLLGSSRLNACIRIVAAQGILLGLLPLLATGAGVEPRDVLLAVGSMGIKGFAFPLLLRRALREARVRREVEPLVSFTMSLLAGLVMIGAGLWIAGRLPLPPRISASLLVPIALSMAMTGLFVIVSRRKALTQVLGFLVLENGIYAFGVGCLLEQRFLIETGVLLDVFVAVFVMGIAIHHIGREFDHIDTDRLSALSDWRHGE